MQELNVNHLSVSISSYTILWLKPGNQKERDQARLRLCTLWIWFKLSLFKWMKCAVWLYMINSNQIYFSTWITFPHGTLVLLPFFHHFKFCSICYPVAPPSHDIWIPEVVQQSEFQKQSSVTIRNNHIFGITHSVLIIHTI